MSRSRWTIADLLLLVVFAAVVLVGYRAFAGYQVVPFALYVAALTTATLGARLARPGWRVACLGYSAFGWVYLVVVLHGGFGFSSGSLATYLRELAEIGAMLGVLCAIAAHWFFRPREDRAPDPPEPG
jgi:hypothetical protein